MPSEQRCELTRRAGVIIWVAENYFGIYEIANLIDSFAIKSSLGAMPNR
jgi:hypothetical protein